MTPTHQPPHRASPEIPTRCPLCVPTRTRTGQLISPGATLKWQRRHAEAPKKRTIVTQLWVGGCQAPDPPYRELRELQKRKKRQRGRSVTTETHGRVSGETYRLWKPQTFEPNTSTAQVDATTRVTCCVCTASHTSHCHTMSVMVWYGMVWCGVVWCGMVWYVLLCLALPCFALPCCAVLCCALVKVHFHQKLEQVVFYSEGG